MVKITALMVLKCSPEGSDPVILSNASDLGSFGFFQRPSVREFIVFVGRTVAKRTPPGQRQSVQHEEYKVHSYNRNGLIALGFMDDHYPVRSAFSLLNQVLDEYLKNFGDSWKTVQSDNTQPWPYLNEAITKFQDPAEADKLLRIQRELDETKIILHKTIDSVLERGEKLDSLVEKSSDLSAASQVYIFCLILTSGSVEILKFMQTLWIVMRLRRILNISSSDCLCETPLQIQEKPRA
ncbi:hypothetical protein F511_02519 [Dorcoceras hygrometricum]|nr:hypothetical protein F511_02519 [Dorcoceras hygrometricum]